MSTYYVVKDEQGKEPDRLVVAPNQAQAIRHVAKRYSAEAAKTETVANMLLAGIKPEVANGEAKAQDGAQ